MKIYNGFDIDDKTKRTITIGNFDGLHIGHMRLIEKTIKISKDNNQKSSALTFKFHTKNTQNDKVKNLCSLEQKIELFKKTGIDELFIIEFDYNIKSMKTEEFVKNILIDKLNVNNLVLGDDARIGCDMLDITYIMKICNRLGVNLHIFPQVEVDSKRVTSSLIRSLIAKGKVGEEIIPFLGRPYYLEGEVIKGNSLGKKLGFPTANINIASNIVIPKYGVYYGTCEIEKNIYHAGINIGIKPSVENNYFAVEAFLIDFDENIYGKNIKINLEKYLREEIKFDTIEELIKQMQEDIKYIKKEFVKNYS